MFAHSWKFVVTLLAPVLLTCIPILWKTAPPGKEPYAAFVICLMGVYWMTECLPIPVTSFIPIILFPLFGILSTERVTTLYMQDSLLFFFGGFTIALSFEYSNLHSRIALKVMMIVGTKTSQLLLGIMLTTMTLSMWMSNTGTTVMMIPIVSALVDELRSKILEDVSRRNSLVLPEDQPNLQMTRLSNASNHIEVVNNPVTSATVIKESELLVHRIRLMFYLGTAYAANIGGTGVITGSTTNLIVLDLVRKDAEESHTPLECRQLLETSFLDWMLFNIPPMLLTTLSAYVYLQCHFMGWRHFHFWQKKSPATKARAKSLQTKIHHTITTKYQALGPMNMHQLTILLVFSTMVFLWVFKNPQFMPGWESYFKSFNGKSGIKEATPTLLVMVLMFIIPSKSEYFRQFQKGGLGRGLSDPLMSWSFVLAHSPWGIFMLLGAGASMALGAKESGLNTWLASAIGSSDTLQSLPNFLLLTLILMLIAATTTVASNSAVAAIVTPILLGISYGKGVHPLFLVLPAATACSYAFMLPVSTPSNALVYTASDQIKLTDMMIPGFVINIASIFVLLLTTLTTSNWYFHFSTYANECSNMTHSFSKNHMNF